MPSNLIRAARSAGGHTRDKNRHGRVTQNFVMDALITKRLHISGLTPALSVDDIKQRFSSFGTVINLEGFGLTDGVGQPRKFGYVTVETTGPKLAKCAWFLQD